MTAHKAHIDLNQMSAYIGSPPKAPLDIEAAAEFVKGKPELRQAAKNNAYYIGRLKQHLDDFDKDLAEWKASGEWKKDYKTWGAACELALNMSQRHANRLISQSEQSGNDVSVQTGHSCPAEPDSAKAHELEMRMSLPDPMADFDADLAATVHAGPAPMADRSPQAAPKAPDVPRDLIGFPIPSVLLERWGQRQEVQDRITAASRLRCALEEIANKGHQNPLYGLYDWQGMIRTISQLQFHLGQCKPEVVCYECDGHFAKLKPTKGGGGITRHCHACDDRGFMVQKQWADYADTKLAVIKEKVEARLAKCKGNGG
jgi:hypothetical protein